MTSDDRPAWHVKARHRPDCTAPLVRRPERVTVDRLGRIGNGGIIAHDYRCGDFYFGCPARVLVLERAVRQIAESALTLTAATRKATQ